MAHQWIRANLASAIFPFETDLAGRTVIVAGLDENYSYLDQLGEPIKDRGIPQVYYMHNCLPTPQGYQSVGYATMIPGIVGSANDFDTIIPLDYISPQVSRFLLAPAAGKNYVHDSATGGWISVNPVAAGTLDENILVTYGYLNGVTYFMYAKYGIFTYTPASPGPPAMVAVTPTSLTIANTVGIVAALGYLIAFDENGNFAWTLNPADFTPSLITGAGGGQVQYCQGKVKFAVPISGGFMIYCERNVVSAQYTGNINFPWTFKEVRGSGGVSQIEDVTFQSNSGYHYAWTTAGMQKLTVDIAAPVFPEVTSFIAGLTYEDFDEATLTFSQKFLNTPLFTELAFVANRWFVLSYGLSNDNYSFALVFDDALQRWGKLKLNHRRCFEWTAPNLYGAVTYGSFAAANPVVTYGDLWNTTYGQLNTTVNIAEQAEKNLGFLQQDGTVVIVNMDLSEQTADGVLMLGKFQLQRNKFLVHQRTDVNNVEIGNKFDFYIVPTLDGQNFQTPIKISAAPNLILGGPKLWRMGAEVTGQNISLLAIGAFNMVSLQMDWMLGGDL